MISRYEKMIKDGSEEHIGNFFSCVFCSCAMLHRWFSILFICSLNVLWIFCKVCSFQRAIMIVTVSFPCWANSKAWANSFAVCHSLGIDIHTVDTVLVGLSDGLEDLTRVAAVADMIDDYYAGCQNVVWVKNVKTFEVPEFYIY